MRRIRLTPTLIEQIALDVRAGNFIEPAARRHGVRHSTLYKWLARGRELLAEREAREAREGNADAEPTEEGEPDAHWSERDQLCVDLVDALEKAEAEAEVRVVAIVQNAIPANWTAGFRWLESRARSRWLRVERQELTGKGGGPIEVDDPAKALSEEAERISARLLETYGSPPSTDTGGETEAGVSG